MSVITFDKLAYIDTLKAAGVDEKQARAQAGALDTALRDTVATKADIAEVKAEIAEVRAEITEVRAEITEVRAEIEKVEVRLKSEIAMVRADFKSFRTELDMLKWMIGSIGAGVLLLIIRTFWTG